ncbi:alpha/beta fold hydrolase [Streptomyces violaceusniger]|uniref:alpha/beta fold hydrolase n=1 Tax=Streptomyces violaceusniger TaxID=68280 RepID=UPI003365218A
MWRAHLPLLAEAGVRAIALDLPGHGAALVPDERVVAPWADVLATLDHLGVDRFVLAGNSLGALVALQVAVTAPGRVAGLVLVGYRPHDQPPSPRLRRPGTARERHWTPATSTPPYGQASTPGRRRTHPAKRGRTRPACCATSCGPNSPMANGPGRRTRWTRTRPRCAHSASRPWWASASATCPTSSTGARVWRVSWARVEWWSSRARDISHRWNNPRRSAHCWCMS